MVHCLAVLCLTVSGYYYFIFICNRLIYRTLPPLTVTTRAEREVGTLECIQNVVMLLQGHAKRTICAAPIDETNDRAVIDSSSSKYDSSLPMISMSDEELVQAIRSNLPLRRAVSLLLAPRPMSHVDSTTLGSCPNENLVRQLIRIYPRLIEPPLDIRSYKYEISLIVPYYAPSSTGSKPSRDVTHDDYTFLYSSLQRAGQGCHDPSQVELVIVHSSDQYSVAQSPRRVSPDELGNESGAPTTSCLKGPWASTTLVRMSNQGRGPCLNVGAQHAQGRILVFCHADTMLPNGWDALVRGAFDAKTKKSVSDSQSTSPMATAFSFGIDPTLCRTVPGLSAVVRTANWRSRWFSLPYGDQCLSVPASVFHFLGGYPNVPLMEDYDLVACVRQRRGALKILPQPVHCSPRRWQRYGAWFVTWTNSKLVRDYQTGRQSPMQMYREYYGVKSEVFIQPLEPPMGSY